MSGRGEEDLHLQVKSSLNRYYIGSVGGVFSDKASFVNDTTVSKGSWFAGMWSVTGPGKAPYKQDIDPYLGFVRSRGPVSYEACATYFALTHMRLSADDLWVIDQKIAYTGCSVCEPYIRLRANNKVGSNSFEPGWFGWGGIKRKDALGRAAIVNNLETAWSDGPYGKDPGFVFARLTSYLEISLSRSIRVGPSILYQIPIAGQARKPHSFIDREIFSWSFTVTYLYNYKTGDR